MSLPPGLLQDLEEKGYPPLYAPNFGIPLEDKPKVNLRDRMQQQYQNKRVQAQLANRFFSSEYSHLSQREIQSLHTTLFPPQPEPPSRHTAQAQAAAAAAYYYQQQLYQQQRLRQQQEQQRKQEEEAKKQHPANTQQNSEPNPEIPSFSQGHAAHVRARHELGRGRTRVMNPKILATNVSWNCRLCDRPVKPAKMREHIGAHCLEAVDRGNMDVKTCGFCGLGDSDCQVTLEQGSHPGILVPYSNCPLYYKFNLKSANKTKSPCTNHPMQCPYCPEGTYIWKYVMKVHLKQSHPNYSIPRELLKEISIFPIERDKLSRMIIS